MGYVSCLEDIIERLSEALDNAGRRNSLFRGSDVAAAKSVLRELQEHARFATDPDIKLAAHAAELERSIESLTVQVQVLTVELEEARRQNAEVSKRNLALEEENLKLQVALGGKRADVNRFAREYRKLARKLSRSRRGH